MRMPLWINDKEADMRNFVLIVNAAKDNYKESADYIAGILEKNGCRCSACIFAGEPADPDAGYLYTDPKLIPEDTEAVLSLGGDGTFIHTSKDLIGLNLPVYGINFGTLGYLTEVDVNGFESALLAIISGDYEVEDRMLIRYEIIKHGKCRYKGIALNDIVINRSLSTGIAQFDVRVDGHFLNHYSADGMIISTPTGSTGYNLSAGGPVVLPTAEILLATPICAHTLNSRTVVLPADVQLEIECTESSREKVQISFVTADGEAGIQLDEGDVVRASRADSTAKIIKTNKISFIENLGKKMR